MQMMPVRTPMKEVCWLEGASLPTNEASLPVDVARPPVDEASPARRKGSLVNFFLLLVYTLFATVCLLDPIGSQ